MDFFQLLRVHLEHQSLVRLREFTFFGVWSPLYLFCFISITDRLGLLLSDRRGITRALLWNSAALARSPTEILRLKRSKRRTSAWRVKKGV